MKYNGTRAETRFRLSAKRTSPFKSTGASFQSTAGSWCVRISGSNAGYTKFRGSVKSTGHLLHSPVSPSFPFPCVVTRFQLDSTTMTNFLTSWKWWMEIVDVRQACIVIWCIRLIYNMSEMPYGRADGATFVASGKADRHMEV